MAFYTFLVLSSFQVGAIVVGWYYLAILVDALTKYKSVKIAFISIATSFVQLYAYGMGIVSEKIQPRGNQPFTEIDNLFRWKSIALLFLWQFHNKLIFSYMSFRFLNVYHSHITLRDHPANKRVLFLLGQLWLSPLKFLFYHSLAVIG